MIKYSEVEALNTPDEHIDDRAAYQSEYEEWVENGCKKAAEVIARSEAENQIQK